jgi:hypothetical protein
MNKKAAALLLGYLTAQLEDIHNLYAKLQTTDPGDEERTIYLTRRKARPLRAEI